MLLAVAATVGLTFPPSLIQASSCPSKPPFWPHSMGDGVQVSARLLGASSSQGGFFLAETRKSTAQANYDVT